MDFKIAAVNAEYSASPYGNITTPTIVRQNVPSFKSAGEQELKLSSQKNGAYTYSVKTDILPMQYISKYVNKDVIQNAIDTNPKIKSILEEYGLKPTISEINIGTGLKKHLVTTYLYAMDIADKIHLDYNTRHKLGQAALLHDIGKALIPEKIIQKPDKLTSDEREIINLHSQLGSEILKTTDIDPEIITAINLHHTPSEYKSENLISQILSAADVFSALKEERPYKPALSDRKAFEIMYSMPELSPNIIRSLQVSRCSYA